MQRKASKLDLLFCISHLLDLHVGRQSLFITSYIYYIYARPIYGTTAINSGCVTAWKAIIRREVSEEAGADAKQ